MELIDISRKFWERCTNVKLWIQKEKKEKKMAARRISHRRRMRSLHLLMWWIVSDLHVHVL